MITLRPYQADLIARAYDSYQRGNRNVLVVLPTGGGKSVVVSQIILDGHQQGLTECVIAHRNELVGQMSLHVARRGIPHRIIASKQSVAQITAEHRREFGRSFINPDARCSVVSVDTLIARQDELKQWASQVQRWTIDECFPAGTMVRTPTGDRPIEAVRVGDKVLAFDEKTSTFHTKRVMRLFKNPAPPIMVDIIINGSRVRATLGHPFWTDRGWVDAKDLRRGDRCLVELRRVREALRDEGSSGISASQDGQGVLPNILRDGLQVEAREEAGQGQETTCGEGMSGLCEDTHVAEPQDLFGRVPVANQFDHHVSHEPQVLLGSHEAQQPDGAQGITRQDAEHPAENGSSADGARRERQRATGGREGTDSGSDGARLCPPVCDPHGHSEGSRVSDLLQTGHGAPAAQDSRGSRRSVARDACSQGAGCEEGCSFAMQRVDSVEVYERADYVGLDDGFVYNIEVDDLHTYVANGIVVHNCHHVVGNERRERNKWGKAIAMFPSAYGLGVTATPQRADGAGLGRWQSDGSDGDGAFEDMILGPNMRDLIEMGALSDYEIAIPEGDFTMDGIEVAPSGDWSTKRMREASKRSHIVGDVVLEYQRRATGKRAICFATDVETSGEIAQRFNDAGIPAVSISAKTPSDVRADMIRRFRDGRITVMVNVDLFGEGFDLPSVEVVIMARPTASLAVYLQQFGRALRPLQGKSHGLIIDHVSNWKRHGFPDKPHVWTLDRRDKRSKREPDPDDIPLTACRSCSRPYERCLPACPYCGEAPPVPEGGARSIEQVDGDLMLLDRATLAELRAKMTLEAPGDVAERVGAVAGALAGRGAANRQIERYAAQERLRAVVEQWAGVRRAAGETDQSILRRFYITTGMDVLSAMGQSRSDMDLLSQRIEGWYRG